jgi:hypothetical protein
MMKVEIVIKITWNLATMSGEKPGKNGKKFMDNLYDHHQIF